MFGFCCKLTKSNAIQLTQQNVECTAANGLKIFYSLPAPQIMSQFSQQMKQGIGKKITKRWRLFIFRQLLLLFVLMVEINPSLFFWLAKKKCSSVLGDTYVLEMIQPMCLFNLIWNPISGGFRQT